MEQFLRLIENKFNSLEKKIVKRIDTTVSQIAKRVEKLETKCNKMQIKIKSMERRKKPVPKQPVESKLTLRNFDNFQTKSESINNLIEDFERGLQLNKCIGKRQPKRFIQFIRDHFENDEDCDFYLKGERLWLYKNNSWVVQSKPKKFLKQMMNYQWNKYIISLEDEFETDIEDDENQMEISEYMSIIREFTQKVSAIRKRTSKQQ